MPWPKYQEEKLSQHDCMTIRGLSPYLVHPCCLPRSSYHLLPLMANDLGRHFRGLANHIFLSRICGKFVHAVILPYRQKALSPPFAYRSLYNGDEE